jgi:ribulose-phosphate 3-epimerase
MGKISSSIMCIDYTRFVEEIRALEKIGVDYIHFDVMDGHFVPNFTLGPDLMRSVRLITDIPMDIHLMVEKPENYIGLFEPRAGDIVCIHQESTVHLQKVLTSIKETGVKAGVALNPSTPLCMIQHVLRDVDIVLVMTVNPGFAGQELIPETLEKIKELKMIIIENGLDIEIEVDGNVSFENARKMKKMGADIFVAGTSSLFNRGMDMVQAGEKLKAIVS